MGSLLQEGRLQQRVRWQALDVHNLRLINRLHPESAPPPLWLRLHGIVGIILRLWVIVLALLLLALLLLVLLLVILLLAAELLGRG